MSITTDFSKPRSERIAALRYDYLGAEKRRVAACNLCGGTVFTQIAQADRYGYPARASFCNGCTLVFLNPVMTAEAYAQFYQEVYRPLVSAFHGRRIDAKSLVAEQGPYAAERGAFLEGYLPRKHGMRLLDIGGSTGVVAAELAKKFDFSAVVLDPSPDELEEARLRGLETIAGFVEDLGPQDGRFDFITLFQTVDHLLDIRLTLEKVRELLVEDGLFYADIVDFRSVFLRAGRIEEAIKIDHPYYLTDLTMELYLRRAGFRIVASHFAMDGTHFGFLCKAGELEQAALPSATSVAHALREIWDLPHRHHRNPER